MGNNIGSSVMLRYENYYVFEIQKKHKWLTDEFNNIRIGIGCIGGKLEDDEKPLETLYREVKEEISAELILDFTESSFVVNLDFSVEPIDKTDDENIFFYWHLYNEDRVCTYYGKTLTLPKPNDLAGVLLVDFKTLFKAFKSNTTVEEIISMGAIVIEKDAIPRTAYIYPSGTVNVLCKLYENNEKFIELLKLGDKNE